jgi:hypothetical protein
MPSRETSLRNLAKARLCRRHPRLWRSRSEARMIRMFVWHWHLGRGPWCSERALAKWLGVSHNHVQKLTRVLPRSEDAFLREVAHYGLPTKEALVSAREESRQQRDRGLLRRQGRFKSVEYKIGNTVLRDFVPTKPNAATLVANNPTLPDAPAASQGGRRIDYSAIHMWNLRMNCIGRQGTRPSRPARPTRWRPRSSLRPFR